jgi:signal peptidase I
MRLSSVGTALRANRGFIVMLLGLGLLRTAIADWNPIPSGSMRPTLLEGDVVLVNRLAYDLKLPLTDVVLAPLGEPQRGDVVTFSSPTTGTRLIKRVMALPGDRVAMRGDVLIINGQPAQYLDGHHKGERLSADWVVDAQTATERVAGIEHKVQFLDVANSRRDFAERLVPEGHYFMLGDNRNNSEDSRFIGMVPRRLLIGRAHHLVASADMLGEEGWAWLPRVGRFGAAIQ